MGNALIDVDPGAYMMGLQTGCLERKQQGVSSEY